MYDPPFFYVTAFSLYSLLPHTQVPLPPSISLSPSLIVLQGMGRAIESNLNCDFDRCKAVLKMGVVKHPEVALCLGGTLGLPICKFQVRDM